MKMGTSVDSYKDALKSEISAHVRYRGALMDSTDKIGEFVESLTKEIIERKDKDDKLSREDFVDLEKQSMLVNLYNMEVAKVDSRLELLVRLGALLGLLPKDGTPEGEALKEASKAGLSFAVEGGRLVPRHKESYDVLMKYCDARVEESTLGARYEALKLQYEKFKEMSKEAAKGGEVKEKGNGKK